MALTFARAALCASCVLAWLVIISDNCPPLKKSEIEYYVRANGDRSRTAHC